MRKNLYSAIIHLFAWIILLLIGCMSLFLFQSAVASPAADSHPIVTVLTIQGAIGPAVQDYIEHGIIKSEKLQARAIVLTIDTPGGLDTAMRGIIKSILNSTIPVISFVYPSGSRAASAGTYILYASHIAAMAPGTNLGAATPISIISSEKSDEKNKKDSAAEMKAVNDAKAYIRSLAQLRNRNVAWAVKAVTGAQTLSASEALKLQVIDFVAPSIPNLLKMVNGKTVTINNASTIINTKNAELVYVYPSWRNKILSVITDPSIAYVLLMIGVYGLFFEFMSPGYVVPGVMGAISLFLALYAFQLLPINYAGFILVILGVIFMVAECFLPAFGAIGFGGIVSFIIGSFLLFDTDVPGFALPWQLITGISIITALFLIGAIQLILRSRRRPVVSGTETLIGKSGTIEKDRDHSWVIVNGERWNVSSSDVLCDKQQVIIIRTEGLTLVVKSINHE